MALLAETLNAVEDEFSGVPYRPELWESDRRLYPPQPDAARKFPEHPSLRKYRNKGHYNFIGLNGAIPVQDLASRYRFTELVLDHLAGQRIAAHLAALFRKHGPPLFLQRDNGSPFNCQPVDEVMARFGVLPLNNPPHFPRYNGAMEKSNRDFKAALTKREAPAPGAPNELRAFLDQLEAEPAYRHPRHFAMLVLPPKAEPA